MQYSLAKQNSGTLSFYPWMDFGTLDGEKVKSRHFHRYLVSL